MKTLSNNKNLLLFTLFLLFAQPLTAQLKVTQNGSVGIGISNPLEKTQIVGNSVFTNTASTVISAPLIKGRNNFTTQTNPDYTRHNNDLTGFFHPETDVIGFSIAGLEKMRLTTFGIEAPRIRLIAPTANDYGYHMQYGGNDNFYVHASGWIFSQGQYLGSDESFKTDIETIDAALSKVLQLRGVSINLILLNQPVFLMMERTILV